jgi:hypothetical protein
VQFEVSGYDPLDTPITLSATRLPPGARFDSASGQFSWDPSSAPGGSYPAEFAVMNGLGLSSSATVTVEVVSGEPMLDKLLHGATRKAEGACSPGSLARWGERLDKDVQLSINGNRQ